jgi:hypothetical protein
MFSEFAMLLYHYTSPAHLRAIDRHGLTVGDVVTDFAKFEGLVGVWLNGHGLGGSSLDKTKIRLTVDASEDGKLVRWADWAPLHISLDTAQRLIAAGGHSADSWYVYFGWIPRNRILSAESVEDGQPILDLAGHWPEEKSVRAISFEARYVWHNRLLRDVRRASKGS